MISRYLIHIWIYILSVYFWRFYASSWWKGNLFVDCFHHVFVCAVLILETWSFLTLRGSHQHESEGSSWKFVCTAWLAWGLTFVITWTAWTSIWAWALIILNYLMQLRLPMITPGSWKMLHEWLNKRYCSWCIIMRVRLWAALSIFRWNQKSALFFIMFRRYLSHHLIDWLLICQLERSRWVYSSGTITASHWWNIQSVVCWVDAMIFLYAW